MSVLTIYNGKNTDKIQSDFSYSLNIGIIDKSIMLNDANRLNNIALDIRDEYSDFIYTINKLYLNNDLIYDEKLSLYFISDLSNKRTEVFDTYITICHILLIKQLISENNIKKVEFCGCDEKFIIAFNSCIQLNYNEVDSKSYVPSKYNFLRQTKFFLKAYIGSSYAKLKFKNKINIKIDNLFLTRFPLHFDKNFKEEKYGSLVKKDDFYLVSIITDGMHQGLSLINIIKSINKLKGYSKNHNILFLDSEISSIDIVKNYLYDLKISKIFKRLKEEKFVFKGIDISEFIYEEIDRSMLRIPRLIMYDNAIKKIFKTSEVDNFYYYLHEYSYGKFFSYILNQYFKKTKTIGFQHGPASMRKLLYFLSKNEVDYNSNDFINLLPMPNLVLAEDKQSKNVYEKAYYQNVQVMNEIYRLDYLKNIKRDKIEINSILIGCGLHDGEFLFDILKEEILDNKSKKYYFKLHPRANNARIIEKINLSNLANLNIADKHISKYLSFVEEVIFTYSSVGMEAYKLGIKVRTISLPNKINELPPLDNA